jgi:myo-inositol-1(or 4)-monophosphatase
LANRSPIMNVMVRAADRAARGLKRDFGEVEQLQVSRKGPADFVSSADLKAEQVLREELGKARPDHGFLLEEAGAIAASGTKRWIVDPLDGTTNFLHGLPHFAISIALEEKGEILAGLVYDPVKEELFTAERGGGAYLNGRRLRVSGRERLEDSLIGTGIPFKGVGEPEQFAQELGQLMDQVSGVRRWGAASLDLAYVAAGRLDGYWERGLSPWDVAAGVLLVREAGGMVSAIDGRTWQLEGDDILAANPSLQSRLSALLCGRKAATKAR